MSTVNLATGAKLPRLPPLFFFFPWFPHGFSTVVLGSPGHVLPAAASARRTAVSGSSSQLMGTVAAEVVEPTQPRSDR